MCALDLNANLCVSPKNESPKQHFFLEKSERLTENGILKQKKRIEASVKLDQFDYRSNNMSQATLHQCLTK